MCPGCWSGARVARLGDKIESSWIVQFRVRAILFAPAFGIWNLIKSAAAKRRNPSRQLGFKPLAAGIYAKWSWNMLAIFALMELTEWLFVRST